MTRLITTSVAAAGKTLQSSATGAGFSNSVNPDVLDSSLVSMVRTSTRAWSQYIDVDYLPISDSGANDVAGANGDWHLRIFAAPQSAQTVYGLHQGYGGALAKDSVVYINSLCVRPTYNITSDPLVFQHLIMHEIGHGIGPVHSNDVNSIMYDGPIGPSSVIIPTSIELVAAQSNFGAGKSRADKLQLGALIGDIWSLYRGIYGSNPDASGFKFWNNAITDGLQTRDALSNALVASTGGADNTFVSNLYSGALGRTGSASEISYWAGQVPLIGRGQVARAIAFSSEAAGYRYSQMFNGLWYE